MTLLLLSCTITAERPYDSKDDDSDPATDDTATACTDPSEWYGDADRDGYGTANYTTSACEEPEGYVANDDDCDDTDPAILPGAAETCDDIDQDCDGAIDDDATDALTWHADKDADGYGDVVDTTLSCDMPTGYTADAEDCDDAAFGTHPGATETCDGQDQDCDGTTDEPDATDALTWFADKDADGFGDPEDTAPGCTAPLGYLSDENDCDDTRADANPLADEVCNGLDDDCDALADDNPTDPSTWYFDADGDGYGRPTTTLAACDQPPSYVATGDDCDDVDGDVHPDAAERCDAEDSDCDGEVAEVDSVDAPTWYADDDGDTFGDAANPTLACAVPTGFVADATDCDDADADVSPGDLESCGGSDEDCDGTVDEDDATDAPLWHPDADLDGWGDAASSAPSCTAPAGWTADDGDCNDTDDTVSPDGTDTCADGIDQDCDGSVDAGCFATGTVDADSADLVSRGWEYLQYYGGVVCGGGDLDSDGVPDLVTTTGHNGATSTIVYGISGSKTGAHTPSASDLFAVSLSEYVTHVGCEGDADGDGIDDVTAVGATNAYVWGEGSSGLYIALNREASDAALGSSEFGDLDGDADDEWVVTRPTGTGASNVYIFDNPSGSMALADATADRYYPGDDAGKHLDLRGDVDGDGVGDMLVGGKSYSYLLLGPFSGSTYLSWDAQALFYSVGKDANPVAFLDDADGDGLADILLGDAGDGAAYVLSGTVSGWAYAADTATATIDDGGVYRWGAAVGTADVDGDSLTDILLKSDYDYPAGLFFSPVSGSLDSTDADTSFGSSGDDSLQSSTKSITGAGDVEGLGFDSILIGGSSSSSGGMSANGAIFLFHGAGS